MRTDRISDKNLQEAAPYSDSTLMGSDFSLTQNPSDQFLIPDSKFKDLISQKKVSDFSLTVQAEPTPTQMKSMAAWPAENYLVNYPGDNTIHLQMVQPGLSASKFRANIIPYNTYLSNPMVEISFDFWHNGAHYFFTTTRVKKFGQEVFSAVFTKLTSEDWDSSDGAVVGIEWSRVPNDQSQGVSAQDLLDLEVVRQKIRSALGRKGISIDENAYVAAIREALPQITVATGYQKYNVTSGLYQYGQQVKTNNTILNRLINIFGKSDVLEAALLASKGALKEDEVAASQ